MKLTKTKLAAAVAMAALGVGMTMPASANPLTLRITDQATNTTFLCIDNAACDTNALVDSIGINAGAANAFFGAGRGFDIVSASASAANTANLAQIDKSGNVTATAVPGLLSIIFEASRSNFTLSGLNPRTMSTSGSATFTNSVNAGDNATIEGFNDPDNLLFAGIAGDPNTDGNEFATPLILLDPPGANCVGGNPVTCQGAASLNGIVEGDPFSLTNRYVITTGESSPGNTVSVQFTDSLLKFDQQQVPEPMSLLLVVAGLLGLGVVGRRRKS